MYTSAGIPNVNPGLLHPRSLLLANWAKCDPVGPKVPIENFVHDLTFGMPAEVYAPGAGWAGLGWIGVDWGGGGRAGPQPLGARQQSAL